MSGPKKHRRTGRRHKHRMGAIDVQSGLEFTGGGIAGASLGVAVDNFITLGNDNGTLMGVIQLAVGALGAFFLPGTFFKAVGAGLAGSGAIQLLGAFGFVSGVGKIDKGAIYTQRRVAGFRDVARVGDFPKPNTIGRSEAIMKRAMAASF